MGARELNIGEKLRARRKELKLSMQAVADATNLSVGFISQIERGLTRPSLTSMVTIAMFLDIPLDQLVTVSAPPTGGISLKKDREEFRIKSVQERKATAKYIPMGSGDAALTMSSVITELPVGFHFDGEPDQHSGEEFCYVLEGEVTLFLDGKEHVLHAEDSAHYNSMVPHRIRNTGDVTARILWVCTLKLYDERGALIDDILT